MQRKTISRAITSALALGLVSVPFMIEAQTETQQHGRQAADSSRQAHSVAVNQGAQPKSEAAVAAETKIPSVPSLEVISDSEFMAADSEARKLPGPGAQKMPCPNPVTIWLSAPPPSPSTPHTPDFGSASNVSTTWNDPGIDRHFRHTFNWNLPQGQCCQFIKGGLQVSYRANTSGQSQTSPNAGNDSVSIWKNGSALASAYLYNSFPFPPGTTGSKSFALNASMVQGNRLSFLVQDDSAVTGAKMFVRYCCVTPTR